MKTAVEWLFEKLCSEKLSWNKDSNGKLFIDLTTSNIFNQAKEMEKEQIEKAFDDGYAKSGITHNAQEYYEETFKSE
jgi:hypothetical protein